MSSDMSLYLNYNLHYFNDRSDSVSINVEAINL